MQVTEQLRGWFEADPSRTSHELLEQLQAEHPDRHPDGLLRTVQRRVKVWRGEMAHALVFGMARTAPEPAPTTLQLT